MEEKIDETLFVEKSPVQRHIYKHYKLTTQVQDLVWTNHHKTILVASGEDAIEAKIVEMVEDVKTGASIDKALEAVSDEYKDEYKKLLEIALRTAWAKSCIDEYKSSLADARDAVYPVFKEL